MTAEPFASVLFVCEVPAFVDFARGELAREAPALSFLSIASKAELEAVADDVLARSRLIGFTTGIIAPADVLSKLGHGAYNFHPGPPEYPGFEPICFALYEDARNFGVTAHVMTARVDAGPIVAVRRFDVAEGADYPTLQKSMVEAIGGLFRDLAPALAAPGELPANADEHWTANRFTRKRTAELCDIAPDISCEELARRLRAFGHNDLPLRPTLRRHGARFVYVPDALFPA